MTSRQDLLRRTLPRAPLEWWQKQDAFLKDDVLALLLALSAFVPTLSTIGGQIGDLPERPASALSVALVLAQTLPLAARRRWPAGCLAVVAGAFAAYQALGFATTMASWGLYLALYSAGAHQVRFRRHLAGVVSAGYGVLALALDRLGSPQTIADYLAFYLTVAAFHLVGSTVRTRRAGEAQRRRLAAEVAAAAERARIAGELHDVVTHHVTAMVIQADAAQFLLTTAPDKAGEGLAAVSDTGRRALTELRHLLGVLEATGRSASAEAPADRAPTLGRLADLVEQARRSGQPVEFDEHGERQTQPVDVELAAYRVVQEALTNAMKHAPGRPTQVAVRYGAQHIDIKVTTDGPTALPPATPAAREPHPAGGRGLAGLRARARTVDGELKAGPRPDGGFEVHATLPSKPAWE
ncbi:sensor histidine kinase [Streptomyces sp. JB150]|uniref:sensor histidine kinase n=1 Tax=Streptomyces sp. JB150 TaxID=2714844 RepID=UPI00140DE64E|nr:sensor histidine kinase [Streptomyces sp. JB150]QIJ60654.1 two-component sensor histidine kinase [Streptomyces sp. JB150]